MKITTMTAAEKIAQLEAEEKAAQKKPRPAPRTAPKRPSVRQWASAPEEKPTKPEKPKLDEPTKALLRQIIARLEKAHALADLPRMREELRKVKGWDRAACDAILLEAEAKGVIDLVTANDSKAEGVKEGAIRREHQFPGDPTPYVKHLFYARDRA